MVGVAGCVAQAEGAEIIRRAPVGRSSCSARTTYHRLPEAAAHGAQAARRVVETGLRRRGQVRTRCRRSTAKRRRARRHRLPHRAGGLRQVLHLLRRALHARRGSLPRRRQILAEAERPGRRRACARSRCSARTSTPGTAQGRTAAPGALAGLLVSARRHPGHRPPALHDQPSARHG